MTAGHRRADGTAPCPCSPCLAHELAVVQSPHHAALVAAVLWRVADEAAADDAVTASRVRMLRGTARQLWRLHGLAHPAPRWLPQ